MVVILKPGRVVASQEEHPYTGVLQGKEPSEVFSGNLFFLMRYLNGTVLAMRKSGACVSSGFKNLNVF